MDRAPTGFEEGPQLINRVLRLLGPAGQRLVSYMARELRMESRLLSPDDFRRLLAFLIWLAQQDDDDIPDPEEELGLIELLWRVQQWKAMFIGPLKLPPHFSIGCQVL